MASLKWKLRPSTSVNDALETTSSSSLEDVSALTGAVSKLRRQSPLYARHSPMFQRRPDEIESNSTSDLAKDLSEALHSISTLSIEHSDYAERPPSPPHSAGLAAPPTVSLLASSPLSGPPSLPSLVGPLGSPGGVAIKRDAPDLVQDLPLTTSGTSSGGEESDASSTSPQLLSQRSVSPLLSKRNSLLSTEPPTSSLHLTTAERFALTNQCTMRKGSPRPSPRSEHGVVTVSSSTSSSPGVPLPPPIFSSATNKQSRRSSCGTLSPLSATLPASVQKLKRMFTEPEKQPPPLSPKPPIKAKPTALLNRRSHPLSPRATPPDSPGVSNVDATTNVHGSSASSSPSSSPSSTAQTSQLREYKQTYC